MITPTPGPGFTLEGATDTSAFQALVRGQQGGDGSLHAQRHAEILAYSRSRGVFAGVSLEGATLRPDTGDNRELYGREVTQREILTGSVKAPASAEALYAELNRYAPVKRSAVR